MTTSPNLMAARMRTALEKVLTSGTATRVVSEDDGKLAESLPSGEIPVAETTSASGQKLAFSTEAIYRQAEGGNLEKIIRFSEMINASIDLKKNSDRNRGLVLSKGIFLISLTEVGGALKDIEVEPGNAANAILRMLHVRVLENQI